MQKTLRSMVANLTAPAMWFNEDEFYMNDEALQLLEYKQGDIPNLNTWFHNLFGDNAEQVYNEIFKVHEPESSKMTFDLLITTKYGQVKHIRIFTFKVESAEAWLLADISEDRRMMAESQMEVENLNSALVEIKRLKRKLASENKKLKKSNEELENFAYIASHDLKEPLRKIVAFSSRLNDKLNDSEDEKIRFYIERMQSASNRMQILIDDLLKYSRVSTKALDPEVIDMNALLHVIIDRLEQSIEESHAEIKYEELPTIYGNESLISSVVQNIIHNAMKFAKNDEHPIIEISSRKEQTPKRKYNVISIKDHGIGIEDRHQKRIFEIFERLHSREDYSGTGIGLAVCQKIMEKHNGKIKLNSKLGEGSTFDLYFPIKS
ncbi:hypothetical protein GYB22_00185 [bacterium]|nr:hypothetical protein [bacterium]